MAQANFRAGKAIPVKKRRQIAFNSLINVLNTALLAAVLLKLYGVI